MTAALVALSLLAIVMLVWNLALTDSLRCAEQRADMYKKLSDVSAREIETLRKQAHANELLIQLKNRKPPKKAQAPDPETVKRRIVQGITRAVDEAMRG
jgi:hypothetical protein